MSVMVLPVYILSCIDALETAGYAAYCVGGCVRDALLGITPHDYDLCTAATPAQIRTVFSDHRLVLAGEKHGTVAVVTEHGLVEITTFRTEGGYQDRRHPDWVRFVGNVEDDLARRDFTVNAMAYSPTRGFCDPFGGAQDLKKGILRAVGDPETRFREDALRILRGVRFSVRFRLTPDEATLRAMHSQLALLDSLAKERIFEELCKLIMLMTAEALLRYRNILARVVPELARSIGFDQRSPYHAYDVYTHIAHVVEAVPAQLPLRLAALLHDIGKPAVFTLDEAGRGHFYGHADTSAQMADTVLCRLKAPTALREQVVLLVKKHMTKLEPERKALRRQISRLGVPFLEDLLLLQEADMGSKGTGRPQEMEQFTVLRSLMAEILAEDTCFSLKDLKIGGNDLIAAGYLPGKGIGACLNHLLTEVLEERLPNTADALLAEAKRYFKTLDPEEPHVSKMRN